MLIIMCLATSLIGGIHASAADSLDLHRLGERMYRDGLLPDGTPLRGYVRGDVEIDGTAFSCSNCHTRSGLGSVEGQVTSPQVNGTSLFKPRYLFKDQVKNSISKSRGVTRPAQALRPAYTEETLAAVLRGGIDPTGRELAPVMPRYGLSDKDMGILVRYLQNLSAVFSPGVTDTSLTFATIVTDDVSPEDRQAMLASLETLVTINQQTKTQKKLPQFAKMFRMLDTAYFRDISVRIWELKGEPSTWAAQLDAYYQKEPVFAILGGISNKPWKPIHEFCETNKIPCLFPITDLPEVSGASWYTLYSSKGFYQEGETAGRFLSNSIRDGAGGKVLQIVRHTPQGNALSSGFTASWNESGLGQLHTVTLDQGQNLDSSTLHNLLLQYAPDSVLIWTDDEIISALAKMPPEAILPQMFISSRYVGKSVTSIPGPLRDRLFITYPFRLPEDEKTFKGYKEFLTLGKLKQPDEKRIATRTFSMIHVFLQGLKELRQDFYRDGLLDVLAMLPDQYLPDFERYSFGPGQRNASKGCYIVQLDRGQSPQLIKRSEWVLF
ncbi:MAG TPA: ABC transporter substrate-binding protein [Dongiaceae bacterium]|nr:ABC transporter substrate-binding protein [Dongiaceae bacterium]